MPRLSIRIYFEPHGGYLGPGMAHILQGIEQHGWQNFARQVKTSILLPVVA